ncbi:MAG: hypothetical protein QOE28_3253 [Solirubrobacteraceae bacterium]|jgi:hypothetical protein|nr:hypothetical protein [Solirubrobacteraceae bacterium]
MPESQLRKTTWTVRYGIPLGLAVIGLAILAIDRSTTGVEGWGMFTGAAGAVLLLNQLYRIGARGDADRDEEESARAYYDAHGAWPTSAPASGRRWSMPAGVVTDEAEEAATRARTRADAAPGDDGEPPAAA